MEVRSITKFYKWSEKILSSQEAEQLETYRTILAKDQYIGDFLGPWWFRELKIGVKRVYFIVGRKRVLLVGVSNKDTQTRAIAYVRAKLSQYKAVADA